MKNRKPKKAKKLLTHKERKTLRKALVTALVAIITSTSISVGVLISHLIEPTEADEPKTEIHHYHYYGDTEITIIREQK